MKLFNFNKSKPQEQGLAPAELYMQHLYKVFQRDPLLFKIDSKKEDVPGVTAIAYPDVPQKGFTTGLTYGLSIGVHPDWKYGKPELCITVKSENMAWPHAAAFIACQLRGYHPFGYGQTINFRESIGPDSDMDAFFIYTPGILGKADYLGIDIGTGFKINIAGLYPMYSSELELYNEIGLDRFWHHPDFDLYNVNRKRIITS